MSILGILIPPGETIIEQLEEWGITKKEFADRMGYSQKHIIDIISGKAGISIEISNKLESVLGVDADFWLNLEKKYKLSLAKKLKDEEIERESIIFKKIAYTEMVKKHWLKKETKLDEKIKQIRQYFSVADLNLLAPNKVMGYAFRKSNNAKLNPFSLLTWIRQGEILVKEQIEYPDFEKGDITKYIIPEILEKIIFKTNLLEIIDALTDLLKNYGIHFIFVEHIKGATANGVVRWVKDRPMIQVSDRYKYLDIFWFSFFHELGHVYFADGKKKPVIDDPKNRIRNEKEDRADTFACKYLYPKIVDSFIYNGKFDSKSIMQFAQKHNFNTGIIIGRIMHDKLLDWGAPQNKLRVKM